MQHVNRRKFTEKKGRRKIKNKIEEIQLANLASLGSLASNHVMKTGNRRKNHVVDRVVTGIPFRMATCYSQ